MYPRNLAQTLQESQSPLPMAQIKLWAAELVLHQLTLVIFLIAYAFAL